MNDATRALDEAVAKYKLVAGNATRDSLRKAQDTERLARLCVPNVRDYRTKK